MVKGRIHSFESLGTADGPGVRAVLFMQGCPLRCHCCHNPDTWDFSGGREMDVSEAFNKVMRCKSYFGSDGGVTVSGGEPLCQPKFLYELFLRLKKEGIHTALDTSGCILNEAVKKLLTVTDLVILDFKYTNSGDYLKYTGCEMEKPLSFLNYLNRPDAQKPIPVLLRQVIISGINDTEESVSTLGWLKNKYSCIERIELLPFRKLCTEKYKAMGIAFPFENIPETSAKKAAELSKILYN